MSIVPQTRLQETQLRNKLRSQGSRVRSGVVSLSLLAVVIALGAGGDARKERDVRKENREILAAMDASTKRELLARHERFLKLEPGQRQHLRNLHRAIEEDPHREKLRVTLDNYYRWLMQQSPGFRAVLREANTNKRLDLIQRHRRASADLRAIPFLGQTSASPATRLRCGRRARSHTPTRLCRETDAGTTKAGLTGRF